MNIKFHFVQL